MAKVKKSSAHFDPASIANDNVTASGAFGAVMGGDDDKSILVTKEGLEKLKEELVYLKETRRKEIADRIKEAIGYGDLSENSEYDEAKNEQAFLEGRILDLEDKVKHAKLIDDKSQKKSLTVQIGSTIVVQSLSSKTKKEETYTIVGSTEADPFNQKLSNESPVGKALLGKKAGEIVQVIAPAGIIKYKVERIV